MGGKRGIHRVDMGRGMRKAQTVRSVVVGVALVALAGCDENGQLIAFQGAETDRANEGGTAAPAAVGEVVERDVEAPEVFQVSEAALWDGRPSLGGVWVAHPDVTDPERVLIRNPSNDASVIGALFRREREAPGPRIQVSSDAAVELAMLAGQPVELQVTALRREQVPVAAPISEDTATGDEAAPVEIAATSLDDPIAAAAAAIDEVEEGTSATAQTAPAAATAAAPPAPASGLDKPYVQIGIFSVEANANNTAASLRNIGIVPTIRRQTSQGKTFWRVIVGPATTARERDTVRDQVRELGFTDAYFVTS